ncbi:hypothetical protein SAMN02745216_01516 [Desulfatibacillum alkenivorans DSM 16219]|jgi:regulator of extracellular matrix RemA (YlzA/DUF370 family)|uniref:Putative regulatory protein SAMN02745216_01516 n=1 Tax=Desulfatibacillum alkenivorans DSM 16219 TaxID=1121393 RepID=A0A1M6IL61_9BACT|nr:hypothetical protein SAMN02745216_01516 [Desulfatibacillum alkenivorans DSM 16219]
MEKKAEREKAGREKAERDFENKRQYLTGLRPDPMLNIGFGNRVAAHRVVAIVTPNTSPMKRLKDEAKKAGRLVDATCGRKTRAILVMDSNHVILSAIQADTLAQRYAAVRDKKEEGTQNEPE